MHRKLILGLFVVLLFAGAAFAQAVYVPKKNSPERKAILDALRVPFEKKLRQKIQFAVNDFNVSGNWAFVSGEPQNMKGGRPDYKGTIYEADVREEIFVDGFFALLKKTGKNWKVVTHALGCGDVCYATWWKEYKAPKKIFPYTE